MPYGCYRKSPCLHKHRQMSAVTSWYFAIVILARARKGVEWVGNPKRASLSMTERKQGA